MAVIAVAGGTGRALGRNVVLGCAENHKVIVLTRKSSTIPTWLEQRKDIEVKRVDYLSIESLTAALNGVNIVISTLLAKDGTHATAERNLLRAGLAAGISRFAPSDFGMGPNNIERIEMLADTVGIRDECRAMARAHAGKFEWAAFETGAFMNSLGIGAPSVDGDDAPRWTAASGGLPADEKFLVDVENMKATLPLTREGKAPRFTATELGDIGRMVSAACDLPFGEWKEFLGMTGDVKTMDEIVAIVEKVRGAKMQVDYVQFDALPAMISAAKDPLEKLWLQLMQAVARDEEGEAVFPPVLNDLLGDKVKPIGIETFVAKYWSKV